jgi:carbon-monoxide dehydrogenase small subunit
MASVTVNGRRVTVNLPDDTPLLWALRDELGLTGTKYGCGEGECGACTILVDGRSMNSCLLFAADCDGRELVTIEGVATTARGECLRDAFVANGAVQCGFCTPGLMVQASNLIERQPDAGEAEIRRGIEGNLCRCTGYRKIIDAIATAARSGSAPDFQGERHG